MSNDSKVPPSWSKIHKTLKKFPRAAKLVSVKQLLRPHFSSYDHFDWTKCKLNNISLNDVNIIWSYGASFWFKNGKMSIFPKIANCYEAKSLHKLQSAISQKGLILRFQFLRFLIALRGRYKVVQVPRYGHFFVSTYSSREV